MASSHNCPDEPDVPSAEAEEESGKTAVDGDRPVVENKHTVVSPSQGARPKEISSSKAEEILTEGKEIIPIRESCLDNLSTGLLQALLPHFEKHEKSLAELTRNQVLLIETLQQENTKFTENRMANDLTTMMQEAKRYQAKLTAIKKEMTSLHDKSTKLKRRALKLQHQKMKENLEKEQQREKEIEEDRKLTAKRAAAPRAPHR